MMFPSTALALLVGLTASDRASAEPKPVPTFSNPTNVDNPFALFEPGSVKILRGRGDETEIVSLVTHLEETRFFAFNGGRVECRVIEQREFEDGQLIEVSVNYIAQADDRNVWYFGEVSHTYDDGEDTGPEEDSWLVGGPVAAIDPPEVKSVDAPSKYMPADLKVGDVFKHESFPGSDETLEVIAVDVHVRVPAGKFFHAVKVKEYDAANPGPAEHKWIVPGVGIVKELGRGSQSALIATSLRENQMEPARR